MTRATITHPRSPAAKANARPTKTTRKKARAAAPATPGVTLVFIAVVMVLNVVGVVMVLSASSVVSISSYGSAWHVFERQLIWTALGAIAFFVAYRLDYRRWQQWSVPLVVAAAALCAIVLLPNVGIMVGGSRRWLGPGLDAVPAVGAGQARGPRLLGRLAHASQGRARRLARRAATGAHGVRDAGCPRVHRARPRLDRGARSRSPCPCSSSGGVRLRHLGTLFAAGFGLAAIMAVAEPYRRARVLTFLHPTADASNSGYQILPVAHRAG